MDTFDKVFMWVGILVVSGFLTGFGLMFAASDSEVWEQSENPDCFIRIYTDNPLLERGTETRVRFCKEVS